MFNFLRNLDPVTKSLIEYSVFNAVLVTGLAAINQKLKKSPQE